jgi:hypothetical protein
VVDENGNPLVVYHGTPIRVSKWNTFNETRGGFNTGARDAKAGVFFTPDERFARYFMTHREVNPYSGEVTYRSWMPHMFSTYLNVQNLLDLRRMTIEDAEAFLSLLPDWYQRDYDAYEIVRMSRTKNGSKELQEIAARRISFIKSAGYDGIVNFVPDDTKRKNGEYMVFFRKNDIS